MKKKLISRLLTLTMLVSAICVNFGVTSSAATATVESISAYGNFETIGVNIKVNNLTDSVVGKVKYKEQSSNEWRDGHNFVRYDGNHMATSIFNLKNNTTYDIKVYLDDVEAKSTTVTTKEEYTVPSYSNVINVSSMSELQSAVNNLNSDTEIRLSATGTYDGQLTISGKTSYKVLITSQSAMKPKITGKVSISNSQNITLNNLEITKNSSIKNNVVDINESRYVTVSNCYIHDGGGSPDDYQGNIRIGGSSTKDLRHLIINNIICDEQGNHYTTSKSGNTYFGIKIGQSGEKVNNSHVTIRGNYIYNLEDGIHTGSDEKTNPIWKQDQNNYLEERNESQELDFYDNVIFNMGDDCIETDGHMVNGRFFRNRLGNCVNAVTVAAQYPGPNFYVKNYMTGFREGAIKHNTGIGGNHDQETTRNGFFYNNTIIQKEGATYCFYRGEPGVVDKMTYKNNIFYAQERVYNTDIYSSGVKYTNETLDYNLLYSRKSSNPFVKVPNDAGTGVVTYTSLSAYASATGKDVHSKSGNPRIDVSVMYEDLPDSIKSVYGSQDTGLVLGEISSISSAIDSAELLPGINDNYKGNGPDIGAFEYGAETDPTPTPTLAPTPTTQPTPTLAPTATPTQDVITVGKVNGLKAVNSSKGTVKVTWTKVKDVDGYKIYRKNKNKKVVNFKLRKTIKNGNTTKFIDKSLKKGNTLSYRVRAYKIVNGKMVFGEYSTAKKVIIKK